MTKPASVKSIVINVCGADIEFKSIGEVVALRDSLNEILSSILSGDKKSIVCDDYMPPLAIQPGTGRYTTKKLFPDIIMYETRTDLFTGETIC